MAAYWRSLACRAWAHAAGARAPCPGPVHLNLPFRDPLVPDGARPWPCGDEPGIGTGLARLAGGRPGGAPWTRIAAALAARPWTCPGPSAASSSAVTATTTRRALVELAERAGWPVLAEPSSGARRGPNALTGYQYLLASPEFMAAHRP